MSNNIQKYRGKDFLMTDIVRKGAYELASKTSLHIYPQGSVDAVFFNEMVLLCEETADYLYSEYTPLAVSYIPQSRSLLEKIVMQVTKGKNSDKTKLLALMNYVRDISEMHPLPEEIRKTVSKEGKPVESTLIFYGGTEEELIKKGGSMCNELARVLIILCQIAGIPSRYVGHICSFQQDLSIPYPSGHGVVEAYIDDKWVYMDIRGQHFYKDDGNFASTWELINDNSLIDKQSKSVEEMIGKNYSFKSSRTYFSPNTMTFICNYFVSESDRYEYPWIWNSHELDKDITIFKDDLYHEIKKRVQFAL